MDQAHVAAKARELLAALGVTAGAETPTFARVWERYFREEARGLDTANDVARIGRQLCAFWGERPAGSLTTQDAEDYRDARAQMPTRRGKPPADQTVDNELSQARRCLNWAVDEKILEHNGLARVRLVRPDNVRKTKVKTEEDLRLLLEHCSPHVYALVLVYLDSGLRRMEAIHLQWPQLEVWEKDGKKRGIVELYDTKNGDRRRCGLSTRALEAILELPRAGRFVFANVKTRERYSPRWLYRLFERAVAASGLEGVDGEKICFHTLRHSFAYLRRVRDRVPERSVMKQGGWKDRKVFHRYGIDDDDETTAMFDLVDENIEASRRRERKPPARVNPEHTGTHLNPHVLHAVKGQVRK